MLRDGERTTNLDDLLDKQVFFRWAHSLISLYSSEEYQLITTDQDQPETIAWLEYTTAEEGQVFEEIAICINQGKFLQFAHQPMLMEQLIQIVARHEAAEFWYFNHQKEPGKYSHSADVGESIAHQRALIDEWEYAYELGCPDEYLECIRQWAREIEIEQGPEIATHFLSENESMYQQIGMQRGQSLAAFPMTVDDLSVENEAEKIA